MGIFSFMKDALKEHSHNFKEDLKYRFIEAPKEARKYRQAKKQAFQAIKLRNVEKLAEQDYLEALAVRKERQRIAREEEAALKRQRAQARQRKTTAPIVQGMNLGFKPGKIDMRMNKIQIPKLKL